MFRGMATVTTVCRASETVPEVRINGDWVRVKAWSCQRTGWLCYTLFDNTLGVAAPWNWRRPD